MDEKTQENRIREIIKKDFHFFKGIYDSDQEMYEFFLRFKKIYEDAETAFYEIFTLSEYYRAMKIAKNDALKVIMIVSLIERLNSEKDYVTFLEWLSNNGKETSIVPQRTIKQIYSEYENDYGLSSKFRRFFQNLLTKEEKVKLIQSIRFFPRVRSGERSTYSFPWLCFEEGRCKPPPLQSCPLVNCDKQDCLICNDEKELKRVLAEFAEFLYTLRSKFVHNARMFRLASSESVTRGNGATTSIALWTYLDYKFKKLSQKPEYKGYLLFDLTTQHLERVLERNFKKLLDNFVAVRELQKSGN